ncbi:MAG: alpha/beta fold hydrolase [Acidimicrobiia bacterium]|nr:alpha/beta fold hydrolase [Acidimicrobiia bacterium]
MARPVVLVHGAWHGPWCWDKVTPLLERAGVPWVAPDLPSAASAATGGDLVADVDAVESALDGLDGDEPAVLVGHSRGGLVITEAGAHPRAGHLVYLTALMLAEGEKTAEAIGPTTLYDHLDRADDGTFVPRPGPGANLFYNDCLGEDIAFAAANIRHQNMGGARVEPSREAWKTKPTTYVVCTIDQAIGAAAQRRMAARAGATLEWDTGHSPFLSRPELVAALLVGLSRA